MTTPETLHLRWLDLCDRLKIPDGEDEWSFLSASYREPHRTYHNLHHIEECLRLLDKHRPLAANADGIEMAIWFHDVVYDPESKSNEEDSARRAAEFLGQRSTLSEVVKLILATKHSEEPHLPADESLIRDIDLSILGADALAYERYATRIRQEYRHVPDDAYAAGRAAILSKFLERPRIFMNPAFSETREEPARKNMAAEIQRLTGGSA